MKPIGGSEILFNNLIKYTGTEWSQYVNLILSRTDPGLVDSSRTNVLWQHLMHDQAATINMSNREYVDQIQQYVYVSQWQLDRFKEKFDIEHCSNTVIKNAIEPINFVKKSDDKIKLIYTSMPNRGLVVLLEAFKILNRSDIELTVFSSNIIYGLNYSKTVGSYYDNLFHLCKNTPGITYRGYATNKAVRSALQNAHIFAYPSIYEETSCLAAIEAGAAGCKIVTTDYGALSETCGNNATYVSYSDNLMNLAENYASVLNTEIDNYKASSEQWKNQSDWFNEQYSWQVRANQWKDFFVKHANY
jgi:glycosyltransferase involved in cell wall biosynthesis